MYSAAASHALAAAGKSTCMALAVLGVVTLGWIVTLGLSGIWARTVGELLFGRGREQEIDQLAGLLGVRAALDDRQRVGNEERAELIVPLVGIDDGNRTGPLDLDDRVVRVGQAEGDLAGRAGGGDLLVAAQDLDVVGFEAVEKLLGLLFAERGEQNGGVAGGGAGDRPGDADFAFPLGIGQVVDRLSAARSPAPGSY